MLKEKIRSLKCMEGILTIWRMHKSQDYRQWCLSYYKEDQGFVFHELGEKNKNCSILVIPLEDRMAGFFFSYFKTLIGLEVADRYGLVPVADWTGSPYEETNGFQMTRNPFEYYFEPLAGITLEDAKESYNVAFYREFRKIGSKLGYINQSKGMVDIKEFVRLSQKYIRLRPELQVSIQDQIDVLLNGKKTVGAHVRGVEWGKIKGHPIPVSLKEYTRRIDIALDKYGFEQIFLATDCEDTVAYFVNHYGNKVVFYTDVARTKTGRRELVIYDNSIQRVNNRYLLGYEVLKDVVTLSSCDGLVAGLSFVSMAIECFKKPGRVYAYKSIIEQKIQTEGVSVTKSVELMNKGKWK